MSYSLLTTQSWRECDYYRFYLKSHHNLEVAQADTLAQYSHNILSQLQSSEIATTLPQAIEKLNHAFNDTQLTELQWQWLPATDSRKINWVWSHLREYCAPTDRKNDKGLHPYSKLQPETKLYRLSTVALGPSAYNVAQRFAAVKQAFQCSEAGRKAQLAIIEHLNQLWLMRHHNNEWSWLSEFNQPQIFWAYQYLLKQQNLTIPFPSHQHSEMYHCIIATIDNIQCNAARQQTLDLIKKAWGQKRFRDKQKQEQVTISSHTFKLVQQYAQTHKLTPEAAIEQIISQALHRHFEGAS